MAASRQSLLTALWEPSDGTLAHYFIQESSKSPVCDTFLRHWESPKFRTLYLDQQTGRGGGLRNGIAKESEL